MEDAIQMYQTLHKWDEALELAKATVNLICCREKIQNFQNYPGYDQLKTAYYRALNDTGQDAKAAEVSWK